MPEKERVGILLVHGMGEQCQFEHLSEVVQNIAQALKADHVGGSSQVHTILRTNANAAFAASEQTWSSEDCAPISIIINLQNTQDTTELDFHEVWWGDQGEQTAFRTTLSFWFWGLSLWANPGYLVNTLLDLASKKMRPPNKNKTGISLKARIALFGISLVVLLIMPVLALLKIILSFVDNSFIRLDIIAQYLSRVRLFQQVARTSKDRLIDSDQPPRVAIRRRMVNAIAKMALQDYDRWYIVAHSQGTVLAFNGIMEIEQALPNYLDRPLWEKLKSSSAGKFIKRASDPNDWAKGLMRPQRPFWLEKQDLIDRKELFKKLQGFLTYGSPLSKFAVLWPAIVYVNDDPIFPIEFEWINIYDPSDPVAGEVNKQFKFSEQPQTPYPKDHAYKASCIHLISHTTYLNFNKNRTNGLVNALASWLLNGGVFPIQQLAQPNQTQINLYRNLGILIWFFLGAIITILFRLLLCMLGFFGQKINLTFLEKIASTSFFEFSKILICLGIIFVLLTGIFKFLHDKINRKNLSRAKEEIKNYFEQNSNTGIKFTKVQKIFEQYYNSQIIKKVIDQLRIHHAFVSDGNKIYFFKFDIRFARDVGSSDLDLKLSRKEKNQICKEIEERVIPNRRQEGEGNYQYEESDIWILIVKISSVEESPYNLAIFYKYLGDNVSFPDKLEPTILILAIKRL
jgi:hypothetical protein